ncbi:retroviral-like aspartic protease family protein [Altererythrobacter sp. ZODW24]|uniref:retroviral-like aspartic protease family protein n=1 Tax=Altererythrobacter sp. ZODW24 TaxID=2185142 RepID=UPI000DF7BD02|nr:retroviral-like aspartic protease family protein [Altererythrobacter sp. ZODW24]
MLLQTLLPPAALLAMLPGGTSEPPSIVEGSLSEETIQAKKQVDQRLTVPVSIAGEGPFRFLVDTGAQATVITDKVIGRLGPLPRGRATLVGMASRQSVETVQIDDLVLGSRTFNNLTSPLLESKHVGADGILGLDSLQAQRVLLDFKANTMTVADKDQLGGNKGFEIIVRARRKLGQLIITNANIDGIRTSVIIDTGSQASVGNMSLAKRLRQRRSVESTMTDVTGATLVGRIGQTNLIQIGNVSMRGVAITFADAPPFASLGLDKRPTLILGMRDLRLFERVAIDFDSGRILFDLPSGIKTVRQRFGD